MSHVASRRRFNESDFSYQKMNATEQFEDAEDDWIHCIDYILTNNLYEMYGFDLLSEIPLIVGI